MLLKKIAFFALVFVLSGCGAKGIRYETDEALRSSVGTSQSRVVVFRSFDSGQYRLRSASIEIDGQSVESCKYGGYSIFDLPEGEHTIRTDMWDIPGSCKSIFPAKGGEVMYFEVKPITSSLFFGGLITGTIRAAVVECAGAFSIQPVSADYAVTKLTGLRKNSATD